MRKVVTAAVLAAADLGVFACGGQGTSSPGAPAASPDLLAGAIVVDVVGINGAQSFSPNPATLPAGRMVVWHNVDAVTHRVVFNDGELDTGNMAPGAFSAATSIVVPGRYHCSIHPSMVGTIAALR